MKKFWQTVSEWFIRHKIWLLAIAILIAFGSEVISLGNEVGMRVVLTSIGIDKQGEDYLVSAQVFTPQLNETKTQSKSVVSVTAPTIADALTRMSLKTGRIATISHCRMIVLGDSVMEESIMIPLNYFMLSGDVSWGAVVIATDGDAKKTLDGLNKLEQNASFSWHKFLNSNREYDTVTVMSLREAFIRHIDKGETFLLNVVSVKESEESGGGGEGGGGSGSPGGQVVQLGEGGQNDTQSKGELIMGENTLIMHKGKRVGELSPEEVRGFSWLDEKVNKAVFEIKNVEGEFFDGSTTSVRMKKRTVKTNYTEENGVPVVKLSIDASFDHIEMLKEEHAHIMSAEDVERHGKILSKAIEKTIREQLEKCQARSLETGADILSINSHFYKLKPNLYDRYGEDLFKSAKLDIKVKVNISM